MDVHTYRPRTAAAALAVGLAAGCGGTTLDYPIGFSQPTSVVVFHGVTSKNAGVVHPYAAIANGDRDDLVLIDAVDDQPVLAGVVVRALAIPTDPRPSRLLAGSLHDGGADLLAVVPGGTASLQVVRTWTEDNRVAAEVDLGAVFPGVRILSAITTPVPAAGTGEPEPGKVRLVLGLTGGRLAVLDFARGGDGLAVEAGAPTIQSLGFDAVSLSAAPGDPRLIFAATPDEVPAGSGAYGVVEIAAGGAPGTWTTALLPTRAPTKLVAAVNAAERDWSQNDDAIPEEQPFVLRVLAALDPTGCGPDRAIDCGVAIVDPSAGVRGLVADPLGEMPYGPPIRLPAEPLLMLAAIPPASPPTGLQQGRFHLQSGLGAREATGAVAVAAANGRVYLIDVGRRTVHNTAPMLFDAGSSQTRTRSDQVTFFTRLDPEPPTTQAIMLVACTAVATGAPECKFESDSSTAPDAVRVTPGFTRDDTYTVSWQGVLPSLDARLAEAGDEGGQLWVAMQATGAPSFTEVVRLYDPALGVHVGDRVRLQVRDLVADGGGVPDDVCDVAEDEKSGIHEAELDEHEYAVAGLLPPDPARFPGGALLLEDDGGACYAALRAAAQPGMFASVRAAAWLMASRNFGYVGRPETWSSHLDTTVTPNRRDLRVKAELRHRSEDSPELACPLDPWPAEPASVACDAACRERCEELSIARKTRRWYTIGETCGGDAECFTRWTAPIINPDPDRDPSTNNPRIEGTGAEPPNTSGPVVEFWFTVRQRYVDGRNVTVDAPQVTAAAPEGINRDTGVSVSTVSGHVPYTFFPLRGAIVLPTGIAAFDKSGLDENASTRFWVSYTGDVVLDFSPAQIVGAGTSLQ